MRSLFIFLALFLFAAEAFCVEVDSYDKLEGELKTKGGSCDIELVAPLEAKGELGVLERDNLVIEGNNFEIDGNNNSGLIINQTQGVDIKNTEFNNFQSVFGGAIDNRGCNNVGTVQGSFKNNRATMQGGAINNGARIKNLNADFTNNSSDYNGGALYNDSGAKIDNVQGSFKSNFVTGGSGGAILNMGEIGSIEAYFEQNRTDMGYGGAVANFFQIDSIEGTFLNNSSVIEGGAIYNTNNIGKIEGYFEGNTSDSEFFGGGAISNYGDINDLSGTFKNNSTKGRGGAVYNAMGRITITSNNSDTVFSGNSDSAGNYAIYNDSGRINLSAGDYDIIFDDKIDGKNGDMTYDKNPVINIKSNGRGSVVLNNDVENNVVNLYGGNVKFSNKFLDGKEIFGNMKESVDFNVYGGSVDLRTNNLYNSALGKLSLYGDLDILLDISLKNKKADTLSAFSFNSNGHSLNISELNILDAPQERNFSVPLLSDVADEETKNL